MTKLYVINRKLNFPRPQSFEITDFDQLHWQVDQPHAPRRQYRIMQHGVVIACGEYQTDPSKFLGFLRPEMVFKEVDSARVLCRFTSFRARVMLPQASGDFIPGPGIELEFNIERPLHGAVPSCALETVPNVPVLTSACILAYYAYMHIESG